MSKTNIDQQILLELDNIKELTIQLQESKENYNNSIELLRQVKASFEIERKKRENEFTEWQIKYSNEIQSLNKTLEQYIKIMPKDYSSQILKIQEQVKNLDQSQTSILTKINKLEKKQKRNIIFNTFMLIVILIGFSLIFLK